MTGSSFIANNDYLTGRKHSATTIKEGTNKSVLSVLNGYENILSEEDHNWQGMNYLLIVEILLLSSSPRAFPIIWGRRNDIE